MSKAAGRQGCGSAGSRIEPHVRLSGFALHGTHWHDEFGKVRSHGCVNLSPLDAAWLFEWTDPVVPPGWHSVLNKDRGTVVIIHA